jgi:hypothetical protein
MSHQTLRIVDAPSSSNQQQHEVMSIHQVDFRDLKFPEFRQIESKWVNPQLVLYFESCGAGTAVILQGGIRLEFKETPIDHVNEILGGC